MNLGDHDRSVPLAVIGLGNPGTEYDGTRHNAGFAVADQIADRLGRSATGKSTGAELTSGYWKWRRTHVLKPSRFMNLSGDPVRLFLQTQQLTARQILVVLDDMDLPLGSIRIRSGGSSGGHLGLADIISALGTDQIPRCRIGVGRPEDGEPVPDHVLDRPTGPQKHLLDQTIKRATESALCWLVEGVTNAARRYNGPLDDEEAEASNEFEHD